MELKFLKFKKEDFEGYKSWYNDEILNRELGPMDEEWLQSVLGEKDGQEYSIFLEDKLIAVVGIKFPDSVHDFYFITDIAVKPDLQHKGIGSKILEGLIKLYPLKSGQCWKTVVNTRNTKAKSFLEKNGWICISESPDEHGMITFELKVTG